MAQKLIDKLPTIMRYAKQQTNFWRDFSWGVTIGHARDWLAVHTGAWETYEGMTAFQEKRLPDYDMFRRRAAAGEASERKWGAWSRSCDTCGATGLPEQFGFCGVCGAKLPTEGD